MSEMQTINPSTGEVLSNYTKLSDDALEQRIQRAHGAYESWRSVPVGQRAERVRALGAQLEREAAEYAKLMAREMGKPVEQGRQEVGLCKAICDYTAEHAPSLLADEERDIAHGRRGVLTYSPIGIVYGIQPWNFPTYQVIRFAVASLAAGNAVLLKHAENVLGSAERLEQSFAQAGFPAHLFQSLVIDHDQSEAVVGHEKVRGITFTGSPAGGRIVAEQAAKALKKSVMELGSNDAYLVLSDADLELAVKECIKGRTTNNGETCVAAKRFIVVDDVYEQFRTAFVDGMKALKLGDPLEQGTDIGPIARKDLRDDLHTQVTQSVRKGARLLCGGELPEGPGFFYPPTVLENVAPGQPAYDDELFGPVASLIRARDAEDAMRIANDSRFGLGGGIFSKDVPRALELARDHFDTGMVFINGFGLATPNMPFGGVKESGYGREHGGFGLREFVNVKAIHVMREP